MQDKLFDSLAHLFNQNGFRLYMIGGTSRDMLLGIDFDDYDFVSDATPNEMKKFLVNGNYTFERFGTVKIKIDKFHIDITTLRIEEGYKDYRHPNTIVFTKDLKKDFIRRDFTINSIYIDENYKIYDFCGGLFDLKNGIIRFIGEPERRIKEDPLRILRAERFAKKLNFVIEPNSLKAIKENYGLLKELNPQKINEENKKKV